jgi:hypothetical protein
MYQIFCDDYLLHGDIDGYRLTNVALSLEVNTAGSLKFVAMPDHPNISSMSKLKPVIKVLKNGLTYWKGRIVETTLDLDNMPEVYCEGKLKVLEDTVVRPDEFDGTKAQVFASLINLHNTQVSDVQKLKVGNVTVAGDVYRKLQNYESTYAAIQELVSSFGGYLFIRYEADGDYIDWLADFSTTSTQKITLGENILDLSQEVSAQNTYTACIPLGAKIVDTDGNVTEERLTVKSLQGVDYVFDAAKVNELGWRYAPSTEVTWDDITTASALLAKAQAYLADKVKMAGTLELTAVDLALADADIDSFNFCEYITVNSPYHGVVEDYLLSKLEIDISNPTNTRITLGEKILTMTDKTKRDQETITITINDLITALTGTTNGLNQEVTARERYIRYVDGVIEIGETGSDLKMRLSNTELSFWESLDGVETRVAYISNATGNPGDSKLYIENGEIVQELKFGNFVWAKRDNGNMSLMYRG